MFLLYFPKKAGFTELQKLLHLTSGNLVHHARRLELVGYVKTRHVIDWHPLKVIEISKLGSLEFRDYAVNLRKILEHVK